MNILFRVNGAWVESQVFSDCVYGYLNTTNEVVRLDAVRFDEGGAILKIVHRAEGYCMFPGERMVMFDEQAEDLLNGVVRTAKDYLLSPFTPFCMGLLDTIF